MRVDLYIAKKFNISRAKAQQLIKLNSVYKIINNQKSLVIAASEVIEPSAEYYLVDESAIKYVSRAGLKLEGALLHLNLNVQEFKALDIGLSTGGFSDCLLKQKAKSIIGVDVGHSQLHKTLQNKVQSYDGVNARNLSNYDFMQPHLNSFDLVVVDVSFISLEHILPEAYKFLKSQGLLLSLVKPQFELGASALNKKGVVKNTALYAELEIKIKNLVTKPGCKVLDYFESSILGGDGNKEFFIYAKK